MKNRTRSESTVSKSDAQRIAILSATSRLLPRYGLQGITYRLIAKESGLSVGAIQHYFESHEDILYQTCRWGMYERLRPWNEVAQRYSDPWERIQALLRYFFSEDHFRSRAVWWLEFCATASRDPRLGAETPKLYAEWGDSLRKAIEDGIASGLFRHTAPINKTVDTILLMISGAEVASSINAKRMSCRHMRDLLTEYIQIALGVARQHKGK